MLQEGIQTILENEALKEFVFFNGNYHEIKKGANGWKFNYVKKDCSSHVTYECKKSNMSKDEAALYFLMGIKDDMAEPDAEA